MGSLAFRVQELPMAKLKDLVGENYAGFLPDSQLILMPQTTAALTEDFREQIFYHELSHAILWTTGSKDYGNELVIDAMGHALKQYMDTKK